MGVIPARDDFQVAFQAIFQPAFAIYHKGEFAEGHPVHSADRERADSGFVFHVEDRPVHVEAVWIWPVQYDNFLTVPGAGVHQMEHRDVIGVISQADILDVHQQHVELVHLVLSWNPGTFFV